MSVRPLAWLNRIASAAGAVALVLGIRVGVPEAAAREEILFGLVLTLGYGHLLGAALAGGRGTRRVGLASGLLLATGFCAYTGLVSRLPAVLPLLLVASVWHTVENDLSLESTLAKARGAARFRCSARAQAPALLGTGLVSLAFLAVGAGAALGVALPGRLLPLGLDSLFPEVFSVAVLYHLLSWMGVMAYRGHARQLLAVHGAPAVIALLLLALPGEPARQARAFAFSPVVYLYWSVAHVVQTVRARLREA